LFRCTYSNAIQYMNFLILGIVKEFDYITEWWSVDSEQLYRISDEIRDVETLDDIEKIMSVLCSRIVDILEENKKNTTVIKTAKIVEEIQQFVREQYAEHGLSLEASADKVGFSSGYIGKLFKNMTGTTFNDYVTHIRMEQAKVFLTATNDSIAQIGERVGVYNVSYFTTLFKKKYSITPSQFREQASKE
jgi:two-component system response regulator YesN